MKTSNPLFNSSALTRANVHVEPMTIEGTSNKTLFLLLLLLASAVYSWQTTLPMLQWATPTMPTLFYVGLIGGIAMAFASMIRPAWSPITAPAYAILEGLAIGAISVFFEFGYPGIVFQAVLATLGTTGMMLLLYKSGTIRATPAFTKGVFAATGGIAIMYLISMIMGLFGVRIPFIHEAGPIGIGFSVIVVILASLNLILDFDMIKRGAQAHAPKYMEWYCGLGILLTVVWLYLEILRLLSKTRQK